MNFFSKLFRTRSPVGGTIVQKQIEMNGKEKQLTFIKHSLKPLLKASGYKTTGNKWWKLNDPFFNFIELQNFSWNSKDSVDFCFNFTTGFTADINNPDRPTIHDGITYVRESYFNIDKNDYWNGVNGYHIEYKTDLEKFSDQVLSDFNTLILPSFDALTNEDSIVLFYSDDFWSPRVKQSLASGYKNVRLDD